MKELVINNLSMIDEKFFDKNFVQQKLIYVIVILLNFELKDLNSSNIIVH